MITRYLGVRTVRGVTEDFPLHIGEKLRVKQPNGTTHEYRLTAQGKDGEFVAQVTLKTPTTNKFRIGARTRG